MEPFGFAVKYFKKTKNSNGIADSVDPDQTAPEGEV